MFGLDLPSTIQFKMPDWKGDVQLIGGWAQTHTSAAYDSAKKAFIDPVLKAPEQLEVGVDRMILQGQGAFYRAESSVFSALGGGLQSASDTAQAIVNPLTSYLKWATFIVIAGAALYAFAIASPFIPRRS